MEYCSEGTLWTAAQQGGLDDYMIRHYTREILKAVDALHDRGVVHRDIKGTCVYETALSYHIVESFNLVNWLSVRIGEGRLS